MKKPIPTADFYDSLPPGSLEHPDDTKPVGVDALRARKRAIREGRLKAPPRDEMPVVVQPAEQASPVVAPKPAAPAAPTAPAAPAAESAG